MFDYIPFIQNVDSNMWSIFIKQNILPIALQKWRNDKLCLQFMRNKANADDS